MQSKTTGIVVVLIIIAIGLWVALRKPAAPAVPSGDTVSQDGQTPVSGADLSAGIQASGSSNESLDRDAAAIDAELRGLAADNASAQSDE